MIQFLSEVSDLDREIFVSSIVKDKNNRPATLNPGTDHFGELIFTLKTTSVFGSHHI